MRRREFIALLASTAAILPQTTFAQAPGQRRRVGLLDYSRADLERARLWDVFRERLRELGYLEGDNIAFEQRWADGDSGRLPALAPSAMFFGERSRLAEMATRHRIATMASEKAFVKAGCLATYGTDFAVNFRRAAEYVDKILRGAKPADLPIEQPTKFELVINLKTAKMLGLDVPLQLQQRADDVIE
jgi:putative ABC transport system substrate-binding protein